LVDPHVHPQPSRPLGRGQRVGERRGAGAGCEHDVLHAVRDERGHDLARRERARVLGGGHGRPPAATARTRSYQRRWVSPSARIAARASVLGATRRTGRKPCTGSSGSSVTSRSNSCTVASPHAYGSSGSAAASATPAAMPTELSSADDTTTGSPVSSATRSAARTP